MFTEADIPGLIQQMTLEEKSSLLSGQDFWHTQSITRLGIPALMVTDGPHGLRKQSEGADHLGLNASDPATCFPTAVGLASTWNPELLQEIGHALGREAKAQQVGVILGPGVNLKRSPLCGRNFEYFSEDPLLAAEMASPLIDGIQAEGIGTSLKHYAANNQESDRMRVDAQIDERTLRELYLSVFERIVKRSQPSTVMCSYNQINGTFSSENHWLLTEVLRDDWGFDGLVVTDWGAVRDRAVGVEAGLDLEMPSSSGVNDRAAAEAVRAGELSEEDLDRAVARVLRIVAKHYPQVAEAGEYDADAHHELAARAAARAAVLLKNDRSALPLSSLDDVVVIGEFARTARFQGAGSSQVNPTKLTCLLDALAERGAVEFAPGYSLPHSPVADADDAALRDEARRLAEDKTVLLHLGLPAAYESEGFDRDDLFLPASHIELLRAVRAVATRVIVLLSNGAAVETASWQNDADAILELWLGGQAGGEGAARLTLGEDAPSGRLPETVAASLGQHPSTLNFPGDSGVVRYGEGLFVGYRGLDATGQTPSYPFGHGLTYTSFEYAHLGVSAQPVTEEMADDDVALVAVAEVKNVGDRAGVAVPQLYLGYRDSRVQRPVRELRGFERVELEPGATAVVEIPVTKRELSYWDVRLGRFVVEPGELTFEVGESVADIRLEGAVEIESDPVLAPLNASSTLSEWKEHPEAWAAMLPLLADFGELMTTADAGDANFAILKDMPADKVPLMFPGRITFEQLDELVAKFQTPGL